MPNEDYSRNVLYTLNLISTFKTAHTIELNIYTYMKIILMISDRVQPFHLRNMFNLQYNLDWCSLCLINCIAVYEKHKLYQTRN